MSGPPEDPSVGDDRSAVDADEPARWVLLAGLGVLLLALLVVVLVTSLRTASAPGEEPLVASALSTSEPSSSGTRAPATSEGSPTPSATPSAGPAMQSEAGPSPPVPSEGGTGERLPDEAAANAFLGSFQPGGAGQVDALVVDLDEDGVDEVVVASVAERTSRVDVARWDGQRYRVVFTGRGGAAEEITDLRAVDVAGDEAREVWVAERTGERGASVSMWGVGAAGMTPLRASGGCADGRHTYGVVGAEVRPGEVRATCDGGPLPPDVWPVDVYSWEAGGWTWTSRIGSGATPAA